jgi:hypothetical protein
VADEKPPFVRASQRMSTSPGIVTPEDAADSTTVSSLSKVGNIVGAFMAAGPPAGCFFFIVGSATVGNVLRGAPISEILVGIPMSAVVFIFGVLFSYIYGIVPAAIAGLLIGILQVKYGRLNWTPVLAIGLCVGTGYSLAVGHLPNARPLTGLSAPVYAMHGLACVFATVFCWRFVRNWYPAKAES